MKMREILIYWHACKKYNSKDITKALKTLEPVNFSEAEKELKDVDLNKYITVIDDEADLKDFSKDDVVTEYVIERK